MLEIDDVGKMAKSTPKLMSWAVHAFLKELVRLTTESKEASATNRLTRESIREACESNKAFDFLKVIIDQHFSAPNKSGSSTMMSSLSSSSSSSRTLKKAKTLLTKKALEKAMASSEGDGSKTSKEPEVSESTIFDGELQSFDDTEFIID